MEVAINRMKAKQMMLKNSVKVYSYWDYCVEMMLENDEDEMVINRRHLVEHGEMEMMENNWLDASVVKRASHY